MKAATENLGFEMGRFGEPVEGERIRKEDTLLLSVLLEVLIRDKAAGGSVSGLIDRRRGAGCCALMLSDAIESRMPPSLLPVLDIGGVIGIVVALLKFNGCGTSESDGDSGSSNDLCDDPVGLCTGT